MASDSNSSAEESEIDDEAIRDIILKLKQASRVVRQQVNTNHIYMRFFQLYEKLALL